MRQIIVGFGMLMWLHSCSYSNNKSNAQLQTLKLISKSDSVSLTKNERFVEFRIFNSQINKESDQITVSSSIAMLIYENNIKQESFTSVNKEIIIIFLNESSKNIFKYKIQELERVQFFTKSIESLNKEALYGNIDQFVSSNFNKSELNSIKIEIVNYFGCKSCSFNFLGFEKVMNNNVNGIKVFLRKLEGKSSKIFIVILDYNSGKIIGISDLR